MRRDQKIVWGTVFPDELMLEGGSIAVAEDDSVTGNKTMREMESRIRELERQLGRKTLENEILKEALEKSLSKNRPCLRVPLAPQTGRFSAISYRYTRTDALALWNDYAREMNA